ncbi:cyanophycin synthetase [Uliginosibacterium sp. H1]|uniref:cyanophycin synthetase n=1 Tax=Uliginosibacterium sp. H1 TaxID=3114757 RepID=UPI002E198A26|nr:cyanophycin synthetase [Uliginosibacterium sp. H1]
MKKKDIEFRRVTYLRGPNIWTYRPVLEAWVDIGELEDYPSNTLPGFYERLTAWLPGLIEHHCGVGYRGGFLERLRDGTWAGHILEHVAIELQNLAGLQTAFGKARQTCERGVYKVVVRARNEQVGRAALEAGRQLLMAAINDQVFDVPSTVEHLRNLVDDHHLGPSTACIVEAAAERRIPSIRLTDGNLVQLGYGNRQRRIWTAETDRTSAIAEGISSEKDLTKQLLSACGVPVPEGQVVESPAAAWEAAEDIGVPVVVKPSDANHGRGVSLELMTQADVESAYGVADAEGSEVIVERYIRGDEHRLLVVGGKLAAAARGESLWITGDGTSTVVQLIDSQLNSDPRRGEAEEFPLETIVLEREPAMRLLLERQGMQADSVPAVDQKLLVQRNGNVAIDCTKDVHPEVAYMATLAARIVGLDIAGVDLVTEDVSRPLAETRGAIVEVNAGPGLLMHLKPAQGEAQPVGEAIVRHLFPEEEDAGRIPIAGISGRRNTTLIARLLAWLLQLSGRHVGLACQDGLFLDSRQIEHSPHAHWQGGQRLLMNRTIDTAVMEHSSAGILGEGLAYDRCLLGIVTDVSGEDELAEFFVQEIDQVYNVLRTQVDVVLPNGFAVLNAGDARVAEMASLCDGETLFYASDAAAPAIAAHRDNGGRAVLLRDGNVLLAQGGEDTALAKLSHFPLARDADDITVEALLAAIAGAWALGVSPDLIRAGVETYTPATTAAR